MIDPCHLNGFDEERLWQSHYLFTVFRAVVIIWPSGEQVCSVLLSGNVFQFQRELCHEIDSSGYLSVDFLWLAIVLQIRMICPHYDLVWGSNEYVLPIS